MAGKRIESINRLDSPMRQHQRRKGELAVAEVQRAQPKSISKALKAKPEPTPAAMSTRQAIRDEFLKSRKK